MVFMRKLIVFATIVTLTLGAASLFAGGKQEAGTEAMGDINLADVDRIIGPNYQLPEGWESMVGDTEKISHFNYGALEYDPATLRNGDIFEDLTGVEVEPVVHAFDDMAQKMSTVLLSKSPEPDMFQSERHYVRMAKGDFLVNVDEMWSDELWSYYPSWVKGILDVDGHYYGVPQMGQQWGLYYRPQVLKDAGFDGPPETMEEMLEIAAAVTDKANGVWGYGFAVGDTFASYESFLSALYIQDGRLVQNDKPNVQTPEAKKALQFLVDLIYEYEVVPPAAVELKESELGDMFVGGKLIMMGQWDYHFKRATNPETSSIPVDDVGFTLPFSWDSSTDGKALADVGILSIHKFSRNKGASMLFMDYMRSEQAHAIEFLLEGNNSLVTTVFDRASAKTETDPQYLKAHAMLAEQSVKENYNHMPEIVDLMGAEVQAAVAGEKSVDEALEDMQAGIDKAFSE